MTNEINNFGMVEPSPELTINTEKKQTKSILSPALRAANALNKMKDIGKKFIELPISKDKLTVGAISSLNELEARTIVGNVRTYNTTNMKLFYNACDFGDNPRTYEEFLNYTRADFITILYGIVITTFEKLAEQRYICSNKNCTNPNEDKIYSAQVQTKDLSLIHHDVEYVSHAGDYLKDLLTYNNDYLSLSYKFSTMGELLELLESKSNEELRTNLSKYQMMVPNNELTPLFIHEIKIKDGDEDIVLKTKQDIFIFLTKLSVGMKEEIENLNRQNVDYFKQWTPTVNGKTKCPHCDHVNIVEDIDLMVEFFLKISAIY